jgi:branched-chain amino acid transport system substrate-binding protein
MKASAMAGVAFIIGLLIGLVGMYAAAPSIITPSVTTMSATTSAPSGLSGTITIGVLTDLSASLSSTGMRVQAYSQQAAKDINAWLPNTQWAGKVTFAVDVVDYKLDPTVADTVLKSMAASGIVVVVGPLNSGALKAIYKDAEASQVVLISPSSTSPALAGVSPYVFRTAPNDFYQGSADARIMYTNGVRGVVIAYRDDTYGYGLYNYTSARFEAIGGTGVTVDAVPYSTSLAGTQAFSSIAATISSDYQTLVGQYGADHVAVDTISFEEVGLLLEEMQASYPKMLSTPQPWYGVDGEAGDTVLTNSTYGPLMQSVRMDATVFGYTNSSKTMGVCSDFASQPSLSCNSYGLGAYDDVWLGALSILQCGANSGTCVSTILPSIADSYYGVTGWTLLTPGHDRQGGDYQIWQVANPPGNPMGLNWYLAGSWSGQSDSVTWNSGWQPST